MLILFIFVLLILIVFFSIVGSLKDIIIITGSFILTILLVTFLGVIFIPFVVVIFIFYLLFKLLEFF